MWTSQVYGHHDKMARTKTHRTSQQALKELEHSKWGWKVLILKYDLGKSLSKEMWCKMADTQKTFLR